jgi:hypothetical protein
MYREWGRREYLYFKSNQTERQTKKLLIFCKIRAVIMALRKENNLGKCLDLG